MQVRKCMCASWACIGMSECSGVLFPLKSLSIGCGNVIQSVVEMESFALFLSISHLVTEFMFLISLLLR